MSPNVNLPTGYDILLARHGPASGREGVDKLGASTRGVRTRAAPAHPTSPDLAAMPEWRAVAAEDTPRRQRAPRHSQWQAGRAPLVPRGAAAVRLARSVGHGLGNAVCRRVQLPRSAGVLTARCPDRPRLDEGGSLFIL